MNAFVPLSSSSSLYSFLVSGFWFLVSGFWFLVSGCWLLVAGLVAAGLVAAGLVAGLVAGCWLLVSGLSSPFFPPFRFPPFLVAVVREQRWILPNPT